LSHLFGAISLAHIVHRLYGVKKVSQQCFGRNFFWSYVSSLDMFLSIIQLFSIFVPVHIACRLPCLAYQRSCETRVTSLSVHDSFGTKGWTLSVHDDFGTYDIHFGTCAFCCTTSVHAKYHFGTSSCRYRYIARERHYF